MVSRFLAPFRTAQAYIIAWGAVNTTIFIAFIVKAMSDIRFTYNRVLRKRPRWNPLPGTGQGGEQAPR
jgi:hypothetical protein